MSTEETTHCQLRDNIDAMTLTQPPAQCCAWCQNSKTETDETISLCGRCKAVCYCSKECQRIHWPLHKFICRKAEDMNNPKAERSKDDVNKAGIMHRFAKKAPEALAVMLAEYAESLKFPPRAVDADPDLLRSPSDLPRSGAMVMISPGDFEGKSKKQGAYLLADAGLMNDESVAYPEDFADVPLAHALGFPLRTRHSPPYERGNPQDPTESLPNPYIDLVSMDINPTSPTFGESTTPEKAKGIYMFVRKDKKFIHTIQISTLVAYCQLMLRDIMDSSANGNTAEEKGSMAEKLLTPRAFKTFFEGLRQMASDEPEAGLWKSVKCPADVE